ncbi:Folylpolyglutamate synthase, mitochondrial [Halotydeus destructor]|nr:Folylpolyglutamate synthase, mitochondrial [Halotydeus destructor]
MIRKCCDIHISTLRESNLMKSLKLVSLSRKPVLHLLGSLRRSSSIDASQHSKMIESQKYRDGQPLNVQATSDGKDIPKSEDFTYESAISALNRLQSNSAILEKARRENSSKAHLHLIYTRHFLKLCDIEAKDLNDLNVIHIAGTKGKGSTGAFVESILRTYGLKTGFFSSPHLIHARERIRVGGMPLTKELFVHYFWHTHNCMTRNAAFSREQGMPELPSYFMFLTVMGFNVFLKEKLDVAVVEVGIGGEYDNTNVVEKPTVVGITSLGYDHVNVLGKTLDKIAWQKAGIFKESVPAFTVHQEDEAMKVLVERSLEKNCPLYQCPPLESFSNPPTSLGISGKVESVNASLAVQLCHAWLKRINGVDQVSPLSASPNVTTASTFPLTRQFLHGLECCSWPGRYQIIEKGEVSFFFDGAHTGESLALCRDWFNSVSGCDENQNEPFRVLLFNITGQRSAKEMLAPVIGINFDAAVFSTLNMSREKTFSSDSTNFNVNFDKELEDLESLKNTFEQMYSHLHQDKVDTVKFAVLSEVMAWIKDKEKQLCGRPMHVLVTGSLHLVGSVMAFLDPELETFKPKAPKH